MNIGSMIQGNPQALVTSYNGVLVADSLEVAERFGKSHKNVLQTIDNLVTNLAAEFSATRFATACITFLCSLPKRLATSRLDATGSPFWVDKMMSFMVNMYLLVGGSLLRYT